MVKIEIILDEKNEKTLNSISKLAGEVNTIKFNGVSFLNQACRRGLSNIVSNILESGYKLTDDDDIAIGFAAENGYLDIVEMLIKAGADVSALDNYALVHAAENGYTEIVAVLLKEGANPRAMMNKSIKIAELKGNEEMVNFLKANM